jgi:hypothetical protein
MVPLAVGCGDDGASDADGGSGDATATADAAGVDADPLRPELLSATGLYDDIAGEVLADGVVAFEPEHVLWSDGATKRRWVYLPPSATIDTSDMDFWVYPVGTKLWKEFTSGGVRVETRMLSKIADGQWYMVAYAWDDAQTDAVAVPAGVTDALGTDHDIPSMGDCEKCHERVADKALGFTAIQLDHPGTGLTLDGLVQDGRLSNDPPSGGQGGPPYYDIPGNATEVAALGYLHANCGGCHHPQSDVFDVVAVELRLEVATLGRVRDTTIYETSVDVNSVLTPIEAGVTKLIDPGSPSTSVIHQRMLRRDMKGMPPLGTEVVDTDGGVAAVAAWISSL